MEYKKIIVGSTPLGSINLTFVEIIGENIGPTVGYVSGIHGNELSSIGGLLQYMETLKAYPHNLLRGKIIMLPFANPIALATSRRCFKMSAEEQTEPKNLNRQFPGNPHGTFSERMADAIFSYFKKASANLVVDLHTMHTRSIPMAIIDRVPMKKEIFDSTRAYADQTGLPVVYDYPWESYEKESLDGSFSAALVKGGIPSFTIEVPGGLFSQAGAEEAVYHALCNLHEALALTAPENEKRFTFSASEARGDLGCLHYTRIPGPKASRAGFFRPVVSVGSVAKDAVIGKIVDETSAVIEIIFMPVDGYISDIIDASIVSTGDRLFELLISE